MKLFPSKTLFPSHGFILPKEQIIPSGEEMWAGFEVVINRIIELETGP